MQALADANSGHAVAYGDDRWSNDLVTAFASLFDTDVEVLTVWGGTGANVVALGSLLTATQAVICTAQAHINVDEGGAPERFTGAKLIDIATDDGKLTPSDVEAQLHVLGDAHHVQPKVVSITQSTELGTLYSAAEITALCDVAHTHGMVVHLDGARIANATVALGG